MLIIYFFHFRNSIEGEEWVNALTTAIKENNSRQLSFLNKTCNVGTEHFDSLKLGRQVIYLHDIIIIDLLEIFFFKSNLFIHFNF